MEEEKKETLNETEEEKTPDQDGQPEKTKSEDKSGDTEKKDEDPKEEEELFEFNGKKYTAKQLEMMEKKSKDFDGILEKRRLEKLQGKTEEEKKQTKVEKDEDLVPLSKVNEIVKEQVSKFQQNLQTEKFNENFTNAYRKFKEEHSWADSDEAFEKIRENFSSAGEITEEGLFTRLKLAAQNTFPSQYIKAIEEKAKSKTMLEEKNIQVGDGGGGGSVKKDHKEDVVKNATQEDLENARIFFKGDVAKYLKYKKD